MDKVDQPLIVSIDPGEARIGFCLFRYDPDTKKADLRIKETVNGPDDLYSLLMVAEGNGKNISHVVCENYRIHPPKQDNPRSRAPYGRSQHGASISAKDFWSEVITIRVIGACEFFAKRIDAVFVIQEPGILAMGRKWCDFPVPKSPTAHIKDDVSAYIHGAHFMISQHWIRGVDDISKFGQETIG